MPKINVTLADHTGGASDKLRAMIQQHLGDIFSDLLGSGSSGSGARVVNIRWNNSPAAGDQDLVLHFVEDVEHSYISQKMPGKAHRPDGGGFTRTQANKTGSEFYLSPVTDGKPTRYTALGYAKLAAHEAMHNATGLGNTELHAQGGIGGSPPHLPVNDKNRTTFQASLGKIPEQLL
jgi:hypothetical protein